ncbi:hypothetical protein Bbelb_087400 [Branchiostoma belcheri]|nr:hypothetical protein Bbelb_087400 [Branchiostoma belcheri]
MAQRPRRYEPTWPTCRENNPSRLPRRRPHLSRRHRERKPCRRRPQFRLAWSRNSQATYVSQRGLRARHHHRMHYMHHVPRGGGGKEVKGTPGTRKDRCEEEDGGGAETSHFHPISIPISNIAVPGPQIKDRHRYYLYGALPGYQIKDRHRYYLYGALPDRHRYYLYGALPGPQIKDRHRYYLYGAFYLVPK